MSYIIIFLIAVVQWGHGSRFVAQFVVAQVTTVGQFGLRDLVPMFCHS